ncbi:MAG TPA: dimethylargininase, partial [Thermoanaerobaculia bacterium]|nr:dimethylargininase [Thermoanaerobaculia bacterium]
IVAGRRIFAGLSSRTNVDAIRQLGALTSDFGYHTQSVAFRGCLHLKSAATMLSANTILLNPRWVDPEVFEGMKVLEVEPDEPYAANALAVGDTILFPAAHPGTANRLRSAGFVVSGVEASELAKAEGALTCCSVLVRRPAPL